MWCRRRCFWQESIRPALASHPLQPEPQTIRLPGKVLRSARSIQGEHDTHMRTKARSLCRTEPLKLTEASRLIQAVPFDVQLSHELTAGGMSRIFATTRQDILVKISDITRGWSKYECHGYELLKQYGAPAASILYAGFQKGYLVVVVERLDCTVASVIKSISSMNGFYLDEVTYGLQQVLANLRRASITFCDLSPDNIMCKHPVAFTDDELVAVELVLIDPQFAVPSQCIARSMGDQWASEFDTVHLSLKIMAMGAVETNKSLRWATDAVCCALLGRDAPPSQKHMIRWLLRDLPMGLRLAYDALERLQKKKNASSPTAEEEDAPQKRDSEEIHPAAPQVDAS